MAESKSAKKNKKRRAVSKKSDLAFTVEEDVSLPSRAAQPPSPPPDPIAELKKQIEQAKATKDHEKAQELRHKMWVLQDTMALGKAGPGAPKVNLEEVIGTKPEPPTATSSTLTSTTSDPTEKKLNRLKKKLQQVEALKARRDQGEKLEANQLMKIDTEQELQEEISILEDLLTGESS